MKLGIISDTHDQLEATQRIVQMLLEKEVRYLIHAGDIGQSVADYLASLPIKTVAVYGNTDTHLHHPGGNLILQKQPYYFKIETTTCKLMHQPWFLSADSDLVIYGHLHTFSCQRQKSLFLNPGEVCAREKPRSEAALYDLATQQVHYCYFDHEAHRFYEEEVCT